MKKIFKTCFNTGNYPDNISFSLLFLRIIAGTFMLTHGYGKFLMLIGDEPVQFADPIGIGETASFVLAVFAEFFASILLIFGVATRFSALSLLITMLVAGLIVHAPDAFGRKELPLLFAAVYFVILVAGAGRFSVDPVDNKEIKVNTNIYTPKMPVLFLGHGSPMNAIEENEFVTGFRAVAKTIPRPNAILCVSAHWETRGTFVTAMEQPRTIHDFGGFPKALFDVQYPAPGSPELAGNTKSLVTSGQVELDHKWGLDHGAWSVIRHLYPEADVPVIQMSLDYLQTPQYHYDLMKELALLRSQGVLIIGSGNMVHNLGMVAWDKFNVDNYAFDWALEASEKMKKYILNGDHKNLINYRCHGKAFELAIPTPEHYLPLLSVMALKEENEAVELFNDKAVAGSLSMTSVKIG